MQWSGVFSRSGRSGVGWVGRWMAGWMVATCIFFSSVGGGWVGGLGGWVDGLLDGRVGGRLGGFSLRGDKQLGMEAKTPYPKKKVSKPCNVGSN